MEQREEVDDKKETAKDSVMETMCAACTGCALYGCGAVVWQQEMMGYAKSHQVQKRPWMQEGASHYSQAAPDYYYTTALQPLQHHSTTILLYSITLAYPPRLPCDPRRPLQPRPRHPHPLSELLRWTNGIGPWCLVELRGREGRGRRSGLLFAMVNMSGFIIIIFALTINIRGQRE